MKDFINRHHLIRRILVFAILCCFLKVTLNIFNGNIQLDTFLTTVYGIFAGLVTLIIKFYLSSTEDESRGD